MSKQILTEKNSALLVSISPLKEEIKAEVNKTGMIVRNVPSTVLNKKNANGRTYTREAMQSALVENKKKNQYESRTLLCTADDHPEGTYPKPSQASHVVLDARIIESGGQNVLVNDWLILNTEQGKNLRALIEAGCSIGTSIRGLGRQNENSGNIEEYEYLGTDVVGNPSAGTFAEFKELSESVMVEAAPSTLVEAFSDVEVKSEQLNEVHEMFNLEEAIEEYKVAHSGSSITREAMSDLLKIESEVMKSGKDIKLFEYFKEEILGEIPTKEIQKESLDNKAESAKDEDVINKTDRHFEAAQVLAEDLKEQNESLQEELDQLRNYKELSGEVIRDLTEKVKRIVQESSEKSELSEQQIEQLKTAAVEMGTELQQEAKDAIVQLEARLERSIHVGDMVTRYFKSSKAINEALLARINAGRADEIKESVDSRRKKISSKSKKMTESNRHGWK